MQSEGDVRVLLRKWRQQFEFSQQAAADIFDVRLNTYTTWENKRALSRKFDHFAAMLSGFGYMDLPLQEWRKVTFHEICPPGVSNRAPRTGMSREEGARLLASFRLEFRLQDKELAKLLGVTYSTYRGWIDGRHVPPGHLLPLSLEALTVRIQQEKVNTTQIDS